MSTPPQGGSARDPGAPVRRAKAAARERGARGGGLQLTARGSAQGTQRSRQLDAVAEVLRAKREPLLRAYAAHLRREDLEDCYSQAALELLVRMRERGQFASRAHIANALEQKLRSRIADRRRAIAGRSPAAAALEQALGSARQEAYVKAADPSAAVDELVINRLRLAQVVIQAPKLSEEQRFALACRVGLQLHPRALCALRGWSTHKERKLLQRARIRLRMLTGELERGGEAARA
ncbi:MAG TPA: hypothetical protein VKU89_09740 [Solirubrobacteraceae bacterium]|nr:hypothetical protein [Solirubrobacteraceae bacterium]